jgi:hypothetical protein
MVAQLQAQRSGRSQRRQPADTTRRALERSPLYSEELGIGLAKRSDAEYFRWFLASLLFGARIKNGTRCDRRLLDGLKAILF